MEYKVLVIDVTEMPIERPKKKQWHFYSGKKRKHTLKTQIIMERKNKKIICTSFSNGRKHDFQVFKESKICIPDELVDAGYREMQRIHKDVT